VFTSESGAVEVVLYSMLIKEKEPCLNPFVKEPLRALSESICCHKRRTYSLHWYHHDHAWWERDELHPARNLNLPSRPCHSVQIPHTPLTLSSRGYMKLQGSMKRFSTRYENEYGPKVLHTFMKIAWGAVIQVNVPTPQS